MTLDEQITEVLAKLKKRRIAERHERATGPSAQEILREFASKVGTTTERIEEKRVCGGCGDENALCFRCKAQEVLGEQATMALPILLPKLALMVKGWASEAWEARRRARAVQAAQDHAAAQQARAAAPPPPAGRQVF